MDIELEREKLQELLNEIGNKAIKLGKEQKRGGKPNISIKGGDGTLWIRVRPDMYDVALSGKTIENPNGYMYKSMCNITQKMQHDKYGYPKDEKQPKWEIKDFEVIKKIVYQYAEVEKNKAKMTIKEIKETPSLPSFIKEAINNQKLAVFMGAGVSRLVGCDGWDRLARNLVKQCRNENLITPISEEKLLQEPDKIKLISICFNILEQKPGVFLKELKKSLKDNKVNGINKEDDKFKIYCDLKNLANVFMTTNADRFFDDWINDSNIFIKKGDFRADKIDEQHKLYKIHGCISDEESLVFTKNQYLGRYAKNSYFNEFIEAFFAKYTVLFVGYSLSDFELLNKIFNASGKINHCYLKGYFKHEQQICDLESEYFSKLGIELIPFSRDTEDYKQLEKVISKWYDESCIDTRKLEYSFSDIDDALEKPDNKIQTAIQNMENNSNQVRYFFSKSPNYQKLYLWLPLVNKFIALSSQNDEFQYQGTLGFLEETSIQNKEDERPGITKRLLSIADRIIEKTANDYIVWFMVKIIFNLPVENITLKHIEFMESYIREYKFKSILNHDMEKTVIPVLIENNKQQHMLKFLSLIFGYELKVNEVVSIIGEYNLKTLLEGHSKDIVKLVGLKGLEFAVELMKEIVVKDKSTFNVIRNTVIRVKTEDEIKQNTNSTRYENQLVFFVRDLLESLSVDKIKPCIKDFLKQNHPIFTRLALHIINCKYEDLKAIFWQWMNKKVEHKGLELWTLLKESSNNFTEDEFNKIIDWIESMDVKEYHPSESNKKIKFYNAYKRKEWLLCLKDNNEKASKLYEKYHLINNAEIKYPGFAYWSSGVRRIPQYSYGNQEELCDDPIQVIGNFDPLAACRDSSDTKEGVTRGLANDLSTCIKNNPKAFSEKITEFKDLEYVYKDGIMRGFISAWNDKKNFNWEEVFNFIKEELTVKEELTADFFSSDEADKQGFVSEIAHLIECGTQEDSNAFDKELLPAARAILITLLDNKYTENESDMSNDLGSYVLNSTNGKVLHALMNYALRYGRLNSSRPIKWENEVKDFFTEQLKNNNTYSKSVFAVIGKFFQHFQFLDEKWTKDNFNKIFPLEKEELWKISIEAYFYHINIVYQETYNLFKDNKHIKKILANVSMSDTKSRLMSFVCIAYINDIDKDTVFEIIRSENTDHVLEIVQSIFRIYQNKQTDETREKVKEIWHTIYLLYKDDDSEGVKKIFTELCDWFVFLDAIRDEDMALLKHTSEHVEYCWNSQLVTAMAKLSNNNSQKVGEIYTHMISKNIYLEHPREGVIKIISNLSEPDKLYITNRYQQKGMFSIIDS